MADDTHMQSFIQEARDATSKPMTLKT